MCACDLPVMLKKLMFHFIGELINVEFYRKDLESILLSSWSHLSTLCKCLTVNIVDNCHSSLINIYVRQLHRSRRNSVRL